MVVTAYLSCRSFKFENKMLKFGRDHPERIKERLFLNKDSSFLYKSEDICFQRYYKGKWTKIGDTIKITVFEPNVYDKKFYYDLIKVGIKNRQYIKIIEGDSLMIPFLYSTHLNINNNNPYSSKLINPETGIEYLDSIVKIDSIFLFFPGPYGDQKIILKDPSKSSFEIIIKSLPKNSCSIPKENMWLLKRDTLYKINNGTLDKSKFMTLGKWNTKIYD